MAGSVGMSAMRSNGMLWIMAVVLTLAAGPGQAEVRVVQSPDGAAGTIADLGNGVGIQSDPHGRGGIRVAPAEGPALLSPGPHGDLNQRTVTPFQSLAPPNQLTPAPVLPFHPNRPLVPSTSSPAPIAPNPGSSGRRLGR